MREPPRSEREQDLVREIVELVGGSRLRHRQPDGPLQRGCNPEQQPDATVGPTRMDEEEAP